MNLRPRPLLVLTLLVCGAAVYGLYEYFGRRMREPLLARGIDVERLRVE